jgi:thiol-disulfide isomerase/thioredoxin
MNVTELYGRAAAKVRMNESTEKPMKRIVPILLFSTVLVVSEAAQKINGRAPEFSGASTEGETIRLSDFAGKAVLVDFWASWCGPCKQELPFLVEQYSMKKDSGFVVIAVNVDKDAKNLNRFLSGLAVKPDFSIVHDPQSKICPLYELEGMPTSVLIDRKGMVRFRHVGFKPETKEELIREINALVREK